MRYIDVLIKAQKVYDSCNHKCQLEIGKKYVMLMVNKWLTIEHNNAETVGTAMRANREAKELAQCTKILRKKRLDELTERDKMYIVPDEVMFNHPV